MNESETIRKCQRGDSQAFVELFQSYRDGAYRYCLVMVGSHHESLDIVQEAFLAAFRGIDRLEAENGFAGWFFGIVRHLCYGTLRQRKTSVGEEVLTSLSSSTPSPEISATESERRRALAKSLEQLTHKQREVIILRSFEELSYDEIAQRLDVPIGTVMSRLYDARRALKRLLHNHRSFNEEFEQ